MRQPRLPGLTRKNSKERPVVWTPDRKQSPWPFGLRHVGIDQKLSAAAASGRLRHEIHDLRIAVEPGAGSFLTAPVEIRIHHHVTPNANLSHY